MPPRDSQKGKVYKAETSVLAKLPFTPPHLSEEQIRGYAESIVVTPWWATHTSTVLPVGMGGSVQCDAYVAATGFSGKCIWVPQRRPNHLLVIHSLAHLVTPADDTTAAHSPAFCLTYLAMVERFIAKDRGVGATTMQALKAEMVAQKIKLRTVSTEARTAASERWYARKEANLKADLEALLVTLGGDDGDGGE